MSLPQFIEIASSILQENALSVQFGSETTCSFPVPAKRGNQLVDAMFLYRSAAGHAGERPFAWVLLDSRSGEVLLLSDCAIHDFADTSRYPLDEPVELTLPRPLSAREHTKSFQELYEAYEQVRLFAFGAGLAPWQRDAADRYKSLFLRLAYTGHYPFYRALSPEFFDWLGLFPADAEANAAEAASDIAAGAEAVTDIAATEGAAEAVTDPATGADGADDSPEQDLLTSLQEQITALYALFTEKIANDARKDTLIDSMHAELADYRKGLLDSITEPFERDIIKIIDDIGKSIEACRGKAPTRENYMRFFSLFEGVQTDLVDLLYRQGVEPYTVSGNQVEILRQQILSTIPTSNKALDKTVAKRISGGWEKEGRVIRPERIEVYVHTKDQK